MPKPIFPPNEAKRLADLERSQERDDAGTPKSIAIFGPRTDSVTGTGIRVRIGLLSDGSYGIERYTASGTRQTVTWA